MDLGQVFDTLNYGKGTAKRKDYHFTLSVKSLEVNDNKEILERTYYITYKGATVLVIQEKGQRYGYDTTILYRMSDNVLKNRYNFNPLINKTLDRIVSYMTEPITEYQKKYKMNWL